MRIVKRVACFLVCWRLLVPVSVAALVALLQPGIAAERQQFSRVTAFGTPIQPAAMLTVDSAQVITPEDRQKAEVAGSLGPQAIEVPFRPTMDPIEYQRLKAEAAAGAALRPFGWGKPNVNSPGEPLVPTLVLGTEGVGQIEACGSCRPPDTHGAVGASHFVEIINQHVDAYQKGNLVVRELAAPLANFFGYFTQPIFDPRVVYDSVWNRWVISAEAFPESPTVQRQFLAISLTSDAGGAYFIYSFNVLFDTNFLWDFPQLGMDQDSVIVTANYFNAGGMFVDARTFAVAKARLYNGLGFSVPLFTGLCGTLAPPIVLDQSDAAHLICAPPTGTTITKYAMTDSSRPGDTALFAAGIPVPAYMFPPNASQTGDGVLDTSDARFINASTQLGNSLWQVHTINLGGFPAPKFYEFNTATNTVNQSSFFFASATSNDWNASIVADGALGVPTSRVFVTWTSNDPGSFIDAQVRFDGCKPAIPACGLGAGASAFTSPTFYTLFRWGDYSAVTVDPFSFSEAYLVNERIINNTTWGTRLAHITLP